MANLNDRIERMCHLYPEFVDITWGAGGSRPEATLEMVSNVQKVLGVETCMHLVCTDNSVEGIDKALKEARACGNQNILALRGDPPQGQKTTSWHPCQNGLPSATALVAHIRKTHGDYFGIGVAAYPELHPESPSLSHDLYYLKQKIDAGADFIVTQLFFDVPLFLRWVKEVRRYGVLVPIIPGVMPIQSYAGFKKNVVDAGLSVPSWILERLEVVKGDEQAVRAFGVEVGVQMTALSVIRKDKPWRCNFLPHRQDQEQQRPIFWANRPKSYISRTEAWQSFPTTASQWRTLEKYGGLEEYGVGIKYSTAAEARCHWGEPRRMEDLSGIFQKYWRGEVQTLPWCDHLVNGYGGREEYRKRLTELNGTGCYLAINSQPVVNGVRSDDKVVGWGPSGGYVYQKAFLEFFVSADQLPILIERLKIQFPNYTYNAINHSGSTYLHSSISKSKSKSKCHRRSKPDDNEDDEDEEKEEEEEEPNTVTWGVFPNHEIVQPTIVERSSFLAWKDEAFALWDQWAQCFDVASETEETEMNSTRRLIDEVRGGWFLMNIVNNDYHDPQGVFELFEEDIVIAKTEKEAKAVVETEEDFVKVERAAGPKVVVVANRKAEEEEKEKAGENVFSSALAAAVVAAAAAAGGSVCQGLVAESVAVSEANCTA
ncbi:hypothetical protein BGZ96_010235 [Linnemannia gamsii]|uniref:MTHFR SAM-binding regulatory domain-containing protein n=1 Tax=Linnemannia gamsii TaxID=64522 RepID=A0ABQ7KDQ6_9FUNG|nr:hypothetical protein BGZ96_010235 [Linnemannia gamsii]